jgi:hypothetical protein
MRIKNVQIILIIKQGDKENRIRKEISRQYEQVERERIESEGEGRERKRERER